MRPPHSMHVRIKRLSIDAAVAASMDAQVFRAALQEALRKQVARGGGVDTKPGAPLSSISNEVAAAVAAYVEPVVARGRSALDQGHRGHDQSVSTRHGR